MMTEPDTAEFRRKLDDFSARLTARIEEFTKTGEFLPAHKELANQLRLRSDRLQARVVDAEQQGTSWDLIKAEAVRDYSSLFDDFLALEERLDAEFMKPTPKS